MTKNIRRTGTPATIKGKPNPEYAKAAYGPTKERLEKADGFYVIGNDTHGAPIHTMRDNSLERLFARRLLSGTEYSALQKYHHHWHCAGLEASLGSVDLNRIFSSDPGSMSGMAKSEAQAHHRRQWREAREIIGHKTGIVVDNVICAGTSLEVAGYGIGYGSPYRAREAAMKHIQRAGDMLERHWGLR
jgi:hypothetical protein